MKWKRLFPLLLVIAILSYFMINDIRDKQKNDQFSVINNDVNYYYAYLPAIFIYHDITFSFLDKLEEEDKRKIWVLTDKHGGRYSKMTAGNAVLYSPFFLMAHLYAKNSNYKDNGYSEVYANTLHYAAFFYVLIAVFLLYKILIHYFSRSTVIMTLITVTLGTNLYYYTTHESAMSHAFSFFLFALFIYLTHQWFKKGFRKIDSLFLGMVLGLITLVRPNNFIIILIPIFYGVASWEGLKENISLVFKTYLTPVLLIGGFLLIAGIQLILWKLGTGNWVVYSYGDEGFFFLDPHIIDGLFSYRKGWLIYTPVMALAVAGLFWVRRFAPEWKWSIPFYITIHIYITFSWWCWWYGGSFGSRPMIETYALLSIPLAAFIQWVSEKKWWLKLITGIVLISFIKFNFFQTNQYIVTLIHWDSMTKDAYWSVFGEEQFPENYQELIQPPDYEKAKKGIDEY